MSHDPLCPSPLAPPTSCECDLIAKVREDERDGRIATTAYREGYAAAMRDGIAAIEEKQRLWKEDTLTRLGLGIAKAALQKLGKEQGDE